MKEPSMTDQDLIATLQVQCLKDGLESLSAMHESLLTLETDFPSVISGLMKESHNLKGNLQAVGFNFCAGFIHQLESVLEGIEDAAKAGQSNVPLESLEGDLSRFLEVAKDYLVALQGLEGDSQSLANRQLMAAKGGELASPPAAAPAPLAPASEQVTAETKDAPPPRTMPSSRSEPINPNVASGKMEPRLYLLCDLQQRQVVIPIEQVVEVISHGIWNPLPHRSSSIRALMNLRGDALSVIHLPSFNGSEFSGAERDEVNSRYIVICQKGTSRFGVPVAEAKRLIELDPSNFQSTHEMGVLPKNPFISDFSLFEDGVVLVLDLDSFLKTEGGIA